jgi:hypothetical protein
VSPRPGQGGQFSLLLLDAFYLELASLGSVLVDPLLAAAAPELVVGGFILKANNDIAIARCRTTVVEFDFVKATLHDNPAISMAYTADE